MSKTKTKSKTKNKNKPNIYINIAENSGVGLYRQYLHAIALREQGLANVLINDFTWGEVRLFCKTQGYECPFVASGNDGATVADEYVKHLAKEHNRQCSVEERNKFEQSTISMIEPNMETLTKIAHWADIIVAGRRDVPEYLSMWGGIREFFNIPFVIDTDDNVDATRPYNPGYRGYYPGSEALVWNKKAMQEADALTVSTEELKQVLLRQNPNIYVMPNCLDMREWGKPKKKHPEVRIGLLVSASHHEDIMQIQEVIPKILEKYPNVHFYYTNIFNYIFEKTQAQFPDRMHPIPWIPLKDWAKGVQELSLDIGLAPLVDNFFNRAKSNLRYMEYSAAKMASIVSPVEPYKCVKHNKTGLVASNKEEWEKYISMLIEDPGKREDIAEAAFEYVSDTFDINKNAKNYLQTYLKIINDFKTKHGKRKFPQQPGLKTFQVSNII